MNLPKLTDSRGGNSWDYSTIDFWNSLELFLEFLENLHKILKGRNFFLLTIAKILLKMSKSVKKVQYSFFFKEKE